MVNPSDNEPHESVGISLDVGDRIRKMAKTATDIHQ
jgi:hypothetical protein